MPEKQLTATLERLHDEIAHTESVDEQTVEQLRTAVTDILDLLARSDKSQRDLEPVKNAVQDLLVRSEAEHPAIVGLIRQIADGLANLGI